MTRTILILAAAILLLVAVAGQPMPQAKVGQCPSGYRGSGGYCASMSDRGPLLANAQGLNPYYGPDGQVYNRGGVTDDLAPVNRHMPNAKASIAGNGNAFSGSRATANRPTHACGAVCRHPPATETLPARRKRKHTQTRS
jgi:hypothetical protein